eukprot:g12144.t1
MEEDARRVSDELRHKHIRTLEVLRQLIDENNTLRKKLENLEVKRVTVELDQAQAEAKRARAAEEASELTLVVIRGRNKELEEARDTVERRCQEQVRCFEAEIAELKEQLASTIAEARESEARAKLDLSRLESEVEELRHSTTKAAHSRVGTAWSDDGDDESVLSQREVENLQLSLRKASRRESMAKRRCVEFERQAKAEAIRREVVERELKALQAAKSVTSSPGIGRGPHVERLPPPSLPRPPGRVNGAAVVTCKGRGGAPIALVKHPPEGASGPAMAFPLNSCPGSNTSDDGSTGLLTAPSKNASNKSDRDDESKLGSGIRRLRDSEKILLENNAKLQRELKQSAKRVEKAESFASNLEAELHRVAGEGVSFESFVLLKRDNQALKTQLAEIKQAYAMVLASSPSKKVNISFSDSSLRGPISRGTGGSLSRRWGGGGSREEGGGGRKSSGHRPPLEMTLTSSNVLLQQHVGGSSNSQQGRPSSLASPAHRRETAMSSYGDDKLRGLEPHARFQVELLRTAGLLAIFGVLNLVPGVYDLILATIDGQDWSGGSDVFPPVVLHLAALIQIVLSVVSIAVGFQYLVCGGACSKWTMISLFCSMFSLFTFAVAVAYIAFRAAKDNYNFIHTDFDASTSENRSVASMIVISYIAYAANNFLALVFLNYKMFMFQSKQWVGFNRAFYKNLLMVFGVFTLLAGVVQLALGAYVFDKVAKGELSSPLGTGFSSGPYLITYSRIAMAFGAFQTVLGCYILYRATQKPSDTSGENAGALKTFQYAAWFVLVFSISAQVLAQAATSTSDDFHPNSLAGFAAQAVTYVLGLGLFPMYLDGMHTTTPETINQKDFDESGSWVKGVNEGFAGEERKTEAAITTEFNSTGGRKV